MRSRQSGAIVFVLIAIIAIGFLAFSLWSLSKALSSTAGVVSPPGVVAERAAKDEFLSRVWSERLRPAVVNHMALAPARPGHFYALNNDELLMFDARGTRTAKLRAPDKSLRLATDPSGALPYLVIVSQTTKWTGAIDHVVTTGYTLHALEQSGTEVWSRRYDPKDVSSPDVFVGVLNGRSAIVFSTGKHLLALDGGGRRLWDVSLWHHPFTAALAGDGLLAAQAPRKDVVRIGPDGEILGSWGAGDGPSRLAVMQRGARGYVISLRQVFQRGPGVRHSLTFFDRSGRTLREVELAPDTNYVSHHPIAEVDSDGRGDMQWVMPLNDGTLLFFSPDGQKLREFRTGARLRGLLAVSQAPGADLLVTATESGLTGWKLNPQR